MDVTIHLPGGPDRWERNLRRALRRYNLFVRFGGALVAAYGLGTAVWSERTPGDGMIPLRAQAVVLVAFGTAAQFLTPLVIRRAVATLNQTHLLPQSYRFTDSRLTVRSAVAYWEVSWIVVSRAEQTSHDLVLYLGRRFLPVPRAAFTPGQYQAVSAFLAARELLAVSPILA
jgi:hypothetical protein